jgi:acetyl esterase/lipase
MAPAPEPTVNAMTGLRGRAARVLQAAGAACRPVAWLDALTPRAGMRSRCDIAYGSHPRQRLDLHLPPGTPRALVVFFYGGSWQDGDRRDYRFVSKALASLGCATVVPDYRVFPDTAFPGFMDDAAAAVAWAHARAPSLGVDPRRLFLMGHSAGAHIAVLLATDAGHLRELGSPRRVLAGAIGLAGPYDFLPLRDPMLERVFPEATRRASQPLHFVRGGEPPLLLASGRRDRTVDPGNSARMAARLRAVGSPVVERYYPGIGHLLVLAALGAPLRSLAPTLRDIAAFIDANLGSPRDGAAAAEG